MISAFLILFFGGMILIGLPVVGCIVLSASSIPLLGNSAISFSSIAENSIAGAVQNNVGLTIVLFMIAGEFMARGKLTEKIFDTFAYFLGKKRAFMPILSICTCMFYGAISGSGPATTAAVGAMCYPMLVEMGYDKMFSAAILVSAGCLGMVIPPSVPLTGAAQLSGGLDLVPLYAIAAVAGVAAGALLIIYAIVHCRKDNGDQAKINAWVDGLRQKSFGALIKESIWAIMTPVIILGTIFTGIADTAQAAAISLVYSVIVAVFVYKTIKVEEIVPLLKKCCMNAAPLCFMISLASVFTAGMRALEIPTLLTEALVSSGVSGTVFVILVLLCMLLLGAFMDCGAAMTIIVPLVAPIIISYGMDPYTSIVSIIICQAVGLCSPLCGLCLFVMAPIAETTIGELGKHVIKLSALLVLVALIVVLFPSAFSWATAGAAIPVG